MYGKKSKILIYINLILINYAKNDEMGDVFHSLTDMQSQLFERIEKDRLQARRIGRIKSALDASASAVMVTSDEHDILYLNLARQEQPGHN